MTQLAGWLSSDTATLSILGAAVAFVWSTTQQITQRKADAREREFQAFSQTRQGACITRFSGGSDAA